MNREMTSSELKNEILDFLKEHISASLATCLNDIPRSSPVQYFLGNDMDIYILSAGGEKFKAIEKNNNICLLVNSEYISYRKIRGVQIFGTATTSIEDISLKDEAHKYCPDHYLHNNEDLKVIKISPREIVYLDSIDKGNRTKQILRNDEVLIKDEPMLV
ncbi:pyridoxamine 5'-phosphate oxidase family protein [Anaeromicrobium sediminis]|uniref:Pyridoxamine 5'-phosphate oxidase n=1 Tax=Anaeromicrobium sediminis TaxID=1478221 RepID=A0A267MIM3_9FIRM|nr:pyridoxamine 5'-phosphate oxidase family protein [Anaeromicrobium sediminis]PAB58778.1 pyridoxamine 5'-phosphate oxidase [Anaeromicrobium sediminis]